MALSEENEERVECWVFSVK